MILLGKRDLLRALAGLAALTASGHALAWAPAGSMSDVDAAGAGEIGRDWLAQHPSDAAKLRAELFPHGDSEQALAQLAQRVHRDFDRDAIFVHKGWFLSETEARLCALIALS